MRLAAVAFVLLLAPAAVARAGNDDELLNGNQAAMSAGAVTATTNDTVALLYNPAGLAASEHGRVEVSASAFVLRHYSAPELIASAAGDTANGSFLEIVSAPTALGAIWPLGDEVYLGLGAFVTRARNLNVNALLREDLGGTLESKWLLSIAENTSLYHAGAGLGWGVAPNLRLGAAIYGLYSGTSGSFQFSGGIRDSATEGAGNFVVTSGRIVTDLVGLRAGAGVQWDPAPAWSLGLAVLSPGFILGASTTTAASAAGAVPLMGASYDAVRETDTTFGFDQFEPLRVRAGAAYRWDGHWISLDADVQPGFEDAELEIDRSFVWNARVGARFHAWPNIWLGGGLFTDLGSSPTSDDIGSTDVDFFGATAGVEWSNVRKLDEAEAEDVVAFSTALSLRYAYGFGQTGGLLVDGGELVDDTRAVDLSVHEIGVFLGSGLHY